MSISYSFVDNIRYGTEDINDIARSLVGAGIAPFTSKSSYSVSELNAMTSALVGSGVQLGGCECRISTANGKNTITVSQGIVYFENGVRLVVDQNGYSVVANASQKGYVFARFDTALQTADIIFGTQLPSSGFVVCLAEVNANNEITDKREIARSKVGTLGKNATYETVFSPETFDYPNAEPYKAPGRYALAKINVDLSKFNYVYIRWIDGNSGGIFDLKQNKFLLSAYGIAETKGYYTTNTIYHATSCNLGFEIVDGYLMYYGDCGTADKYVVKENYKKTFKLIFM